MPLFYMTNFSSVFTLESNAGVLILIVPSYEPMESVTSLLAVKSFYASLDSIFMNKLVSGTSCFFIS